MRYTVLLLATLMLLAACGSYTDSGYAFPKGTNFTPEPQIQRETITVDNAPLERKNPTLLVESTVDLKTQEFIADNKTLPGDWRENGYVTLLVSDGEKAARLVLPTGKTVTLPTRTPVTIHLLAINAQTAQLSIDEENHFVSENEEVWTANDTVVVFIEDIIA